MNLAKRIFIMSTVVVSLAGCVTLDPYTGEEKVSSATIGSGVGALSGALVGGLAGDTEGALIGAGVGAIAGGAIGSALDREDAELRAYLRNSGVQVKRINRNNIRLIMAGDITFKHDRAEIRSSFYSVLNSVAHVLKKYDNTTIKVVGYTSSVGQAMYNQILSEKRANAVVAYLRAQGIKGSRLSAIGYGARKPIASNSTEEGQAKNRRVEITIHNLDI